MSKHNSESPENPEPAVTVLLVDDEEISRRGFAAALQECDHIRLVGSTSVCPDIHRLVRTVRPDVVLINAATATAWQETVRHLVAAPAPHAPPVVVVTRAGLEGLLDAIQAGAAGVLLRDVSVDELEYAIRHVAAGHAVISPAATAHLMTRLRLLVRTDPGVQDLTAVRQLSRREREILAGLAAGRSNQEIARQMHLTVATVKSHVSKILTKLHVRDRVQAALLGQWAALMAELDGESMGVLLGGRSQSGYRR